MHLASSTSVRSCRRTCRQFIGRTFTGILMGRGYGTSGPPHRRSSWRVAVRPRKVPLTLRACIRRCVVSPGMAWFEAEHAPGAVDGEQRAELGDVAGQGDIGEDLAHELGRWSVHDGVCGGDEEARAIRHGIRGRLEGKTAGGGDITLVDVAPQVPLARGGSGQNEGNCW